VTATRCITCGQHLNPEPVPCAANPGPDCAACGHPAMAHDRTRVCLTCLVAKRVRAAADKAHP
jgi:DNA-directed RNA polymerase subunit RPC12/RpoP